MLSLLQQLYGIRYLTAIQHLHILISPGLPFRHRPHGNLLLRLLRIDIPDYPAYLWLPAVAPLQELLPEYLALHDLMDGETQVAPDRLELLRLDLLVLLDVFLLFEGRVAGLLGVDRGEEGALEGVAVEDAHLPEDDHARGRFFGGFVREFAVGEGEQLVPLTHEVGDQTDQVVVLVLVDITLRASTSVHKNVFLATMTMKITIKQHCIVSGTLFCKHLRVVYGGMQKFRGICPSTIEVYTQYVATVISVNHAVRVQHGHDLKNELFSEGLRLLARWL